MQKKITVNVIHFQEGKLIARLYSTIKESQMEKMLDTAKKRKRKRGKASRGQNRSG